MASCPEDALEMLNNAEQDFDLVILDYDFGPKMNGLEALPKIKKIRADLPVTVFRIWRCDGEYRLAVGEGQTLEPRQPLLGSNGLAQMADCDVNEWFEELIHAGMPHHVAVVGGHHARTLKRWARLAGVRLI